ncbi:MAG: hypothetical protein P8X92_01810 [Dehalococcoidia bacterium]
MVKIEPAVLETEFKSKPPEICTKPYCHGTSFVKHEDGWQCLNCMKIIYRYKPVVDSEQREVCGSHRYNPVI